MTEDFTQPVHCGGSHKYIINYSKIDLQTLIDNPAILNQFSGIFVYNIVLEIVNDKDNNHLSKSLNGYEDLATISGYIYDFLESNGNVILYFYCDTKEVYFNKKNKDTSYQEFRNNLFTIMFHRFCGRLNLNEYMDISIKINSTEEIYYTHIIAHTMHEDKVRLLSELLNDMNKQ